jgi:hypothetical protein
MLRALAFLIIIGLAITPVACRRQAPPAPTADSASPVRAVR